MNCPKCGLFNPPEATYCCNCGKSLKIEYGEPGNPHYQQPSQLKTQTKTFYKSSWFYISATIVVVVIYALVNNALRTKGAVGYEIVEAEFIGTRWDNRMKYAIVVDSTITREQVKPTARKIIKVITSKDKDIDEITLYLYSDKSVIGESYDIAMVDWGYPENKGKIEFYIKEDFEQYIIQRAKSETLFGLTEQTRREIFKEIVLAEDRADAEEPNATTYRLSDKYIQEVRQKYNITEETERKISLEAFKENWPLP